MCGGGEGFLARDGLEVRVLYANLHHPAFYALLPQARGNAVANGGAGAVQVRFTGQVAAERHAVADAFHLAHVAEVAHGVVVNPVCIVGKHGPGLAEALCEKRAVGAGQLADGVDSHARKGLLHAFAAKHQRAGGQGKHNRAVVFAADYRGGVRLFIVASQFRKDFVERDANRNRQPGFPADDGAQLVGNRFAAAEQRVAAGYVEPAFVDAERLHQVGVAPVNFVDLPRAFPVLLKMGSGQHKAGAFAFCLPDGFRRPNAIPLRLFVLGEDNAVPALRVAADGHRYPGKFRLQQAFHGSEERVAVAVQNCSAHHTSPPVLILIPFYQKKTAQAKSCA